MVNFTAAVERTKHAVADPQFQATVERLNAVERRLEKADDIINRFNTSLDKNPRGKFVKIN